MNRIRKKGSDSDQSSVVSGNGTARIRAVADALEWPADSEPIPKKFGSSKASSILSYRMDDDENDVPTPKRVGSSRRASSIRSHRMDDDENNVPTPKLVGSSRKASNIRSYRMDDDENDLPIPKIVGSSRKGSSIRSYRMDDDEDDLPSPKIVGSSRKASSISSYRMDDDENDLPIPKIVGSSRKASSIRSYRMDDDYDDGKDVPSQRKIGSSSKASSIRSYRMDDDERDIAPRVSMGPVQSPYTRNRTPRIGQNSIYSDPYAALRIADTSRRSNDLESSYTRTPIRIAADSQLNNESYVSGNDDVNTDPYVALKIAGSGQSGAILYDSNGSSGSGEYADSSDIGGDSGSEEDNDDFTTNNARVSVAGSERGQGKDGGYARVSVAGSSGNYGNNIGRQFSGNARVSVAGSESDHANDRGEKVQGYARLSAPASADVYASESDHGNGNYPKVSVAASEIYPGQDVYARLSVAGSAAEQASGVRRDSTAYARVSSMGSEVDHGKEGYARIHASSSEAEYGNGFDTDVSGHERLTAVERKVDNVTVDTEDKDQEPEDNEYAAYLELSPDLQAKLQYRMRLVLTSPLFELKHRNLSDFFDIYRSKFGVDEGNFSFSSVASLCRAMPSVVQRKQLKNNEELILVDSIENRRAVSGIRSGLRRIVYDALKSVHEELTCAEFEGKCSELLGKPLVEVLSEHGYDTPSVESLIKDMPDIACFKEAGLEAQVHLCTGAEDPALTDRLLVKSVVVASLNTPKAAELKGVVSEGEDAGEDAKGFGHLKIGSGVTLRSLKEEFGRPEGFSSTSVSSLEEEYLQIRLRMRILLAFYNSGHGLEATDLPKIYAKTFGQSLNLEELGFKSIIELAGHWQDIFLLQGPKPGWICLVPSQANRRILNTLRTGLRSSVFSVLVETYPEGLDPLEFLHRLQEGMSGELWDVLEATGYICSDAEKAERTLSSSTSSDFQLVDFEEICLLLDDMMDFVRLGSNEDGSAVVKLRNGEVPLVDLLDCKLNEGDMGSFDELFVNLMMIAVDVTDTSGAEDGSSVNDGFISVGRVQSLVKSFEGSGGLRLAHSQETDSLRLKYELLLILGCPEYSESGLALNELSNVYKGRTGQELGSKSKVRSLLRSMPDIVSKDSVVGNVVQLRKTPKNLRILSTTRAGLRQVLFWALVKNPGGIWANLLEGWFTDFSGVSLAVTLQMHGYEMSKSKPFFPVNVFLRDMSDLLQKKSQSLEVYTWAGEVKDPIHNDASLLGLSELLIQYDPLKFELAEVSKREAEPVEELVDKSVLKEDDGPKETHTVNDAVLEKSPLKEAKGDATAGWEEKPSFDTRTKEGKSDRELKLDHQGVDQPSMEQESRRKEIHYVESGDELGRGAIEGSEGLRCTVESKSADDLGSGEIERPVGQVGIVESKQDFEQVLDVPTNDHTYGEQRPNSSGRNQPGSGENEQGAEEDESGSKVIGEQLSDSNDEVRPGSEESEEDAEEDESHVPQIKGDQLRSASESYAQLRVAQKGPKVKLDEQYSDSDGEDGSDSGENEEAADEDESQLPRVEGDQLRSTSESYAQLRVTGKGPKVNLDEWQFTDSEDEEAEESGEEEEEVDEGEEEEEDEEDEDEEDEDEEGEEGDDEERDEDDEKNAKTANTIQEPGHTLPTDSYVGPKVKEAGKDVSRARVLPNKGLPWK